MKAIRPVARGVVALVPLSRWIPYQYECSPDNALTKGSLTLSPAQSEKAMQLPFILLLAIEAYLVYSQSSVSPINDQCYSISDFASRCTSVHNGVMNGARCFFLLQTKVNWTDAWSLCASNGGTLAQIHTQGEFTAVVNYNLREKKPVLCSFFLQVFSIISNKIALAAYARTPASNPPCFFDRNDTAWYDTSTSPNAKLIGQHTWLRTHAEDDCGRHAPYQFCGAAYGVLFGDTPCSSLQYPLCVITSEFPTVVSRPYLTWKML